ncbi:hypothetical protein COB57_05650 [Candidatus Peregrinibacteria bacterium]|nr:MAG: hypothetical protein COB57_05650 [Candidatus Peregrinibacteria bacterium]
MKTVKLSCACGKVNGRAKNVSPSTGNRIICHCFDCQSFAKYLKKESEVLDEYLGTDIFQMPIAHVEILEGHNHLRCIQIRPKGLHRWYAQCCKTPIGNTMTAGSPFIGVIHSFMQDEGTREENLGPVLGYMFTKKTFPASVPTKVLRTVMRIMGKLAVWKLKGLNNPSSFFLANGKPVSKPEVLNK